MDNEGRARGGTDTELTSLTSTGTSEKVLILKRREIKVKAYQVGEVALPTVEP